jgi:hypothetical protein
LLAVEVAEFTVEQITLLVLVPLALVVVVAE